MKKTNELNIGEIEKKIGYTFKDKSLLIQAFTRTSYCNEINPTVKTKYHSNEVLEFFGDGVLSLSIISFLLKECTERYEHGIKTELGEGDFSNIKSKLSDKQNLSKSMKALGLEKYLLMGEGDYKLSIQNEPSVMEDLFESIVGAIFIDSDMSIGAVIKSVSGMLDMSVYTDRQKISQSAKNALQEWCADKKRRLPPPRYETLSEDGPDHKKTYVRGCYIGDKLMGRGIGKNFKIADSEAAEDALKALMAQSGEAAKTIEVKEPQRLKESENKKETKKPEEAPKKEDNTTIPVVKISDVVKNNGIKKVGASITLKNYAISNKKSTPTFRDLGEKRIGNKVECSVECSFIGEVIVGTGATRLEAREAACQLMVEKIGIGKKKKSAKKSPAKKSEPKEKPEQKPTQKTAAQSNEQSNESTKDQTKQNQSAKRRRQKSRPPRRSPPATSRKSPTKTAKRRLTKNPKTKI